MSQLEQHRRGARALIIMLVCLAVYTFADLASKEWALDALSRENPNRSPVCEPDASGRLSYQRLPLPSRSIVDGVLRATYAENCGAAFSMLRSAPGWLRALVFGVAALGAAIVLPVMFVRGSGGRPFAGAVPLILAGAIGNLSDRVRHGFVVDFIQVDPKLFSYPVFNVADIWLAIGVGLLLLDGFRTPTPSAPSSPPSPAS